MALLSHFRCWLSVLVCATPALASHPCAVCHPKQVEGYAKTGMSRSLTRDISQPAGRFVHAASGSTFVIQSSGGSMRQAVERAGLKAEYPVAYVIGSGNKAFGYLVQIGDWLFQSPISYYSARRIWDLAPGYETNTAPDFNRPVTPECLFCHSGAFRPRRETVNRYEDPPFVAEAITCDRCHGPAEKHLVRASAETIVNPRRLAPRARDSICEQCHLGGEARIRNPGKLWTDFTPGRELEEVFTVYVRRSEEKEPKFKVVSHAEQLARSVCARRSAGKMWCGSCHDPHDKPANARQHYRERCLRCHAPTLPELHAAASADCVGCHMQSRQAVDGAHAAFTDHEIARRPSPEPAASPTFGLAPWRPAPAALARRNLALAYLTVGETNRSAEDLNEAFRLLVETQRSFPQDPDITAGLGLILFLKDLPREAVRAFELALKLRPGYAPWYQNLAAAWRASGETQKAISALETAIQLDPSLETAYFMLADMYGDSEHGAARRRTLDRYLQFRNQSMEARRLR